MARHVHLILPALLLLLLLTAFEWPPSSAAIPTWPLGTVALQTPAPPLSSAAIPTWPPGTVALQTPAPPLSSAAIPTRPPGTVALQTPAPPLSSAAIPTRPPGTVALQTPAPPPMGAPTPAEAARTREHAREGRRIYFAGLAWEALLFVGFFLLGGPRLFAKLARGTSVPPVLSTLKAGVVWLVAWTLLLLPFDVYGSFLWPHRWGLSHQTLLQWGRDWAVEAGVNAVITLALLVGAYAIIRRWPHTWWLWMGAAAAPLIVAGVLLQPLVIDPLTNTFTPLPDAALRQDILTLAAAHGVPLRDVEVMNASRQGDWVNAYVTGLGPSRRMVLYDNLLARFPRDEVLFIAAHELGHAAHHDIPAGITLAILGVFAASWLLFHASRAVFTRWRAAVLGGQATPAPRLSAPEVADPAGLPVLMALLFLLMIVATPIQCSLTRPVEARADAFAIAAYPHPAAAVSAFHRLAALNLSDEDPPPWVELLLSTHPSTRHRIEAVMRH